MQLQAIDWIIVVVSLVICFSPALFFGKRSAKGTSEFFASGRSAPWWLAGLSMVATTFSSDTPNFVTNVVRTEGVAGNWCWWAFVLTGVSTVFFYARLWRRSGVMTDLEFYELRYSGVAAKVVRGFRAVYLGFFFNCIIMASVNLAACKIAGVLLDLSPWQTLLFVGLLNVVFAAHSGLWGVLVIDMIQFFLKMAAVIAAAYFAVKLPAVGGLHGLIEKLSRTEGPGGINYLNMLPDFSSHWDILLAVFIMPIAVQWWAVWYPGAEPGGGSYIAQRMLASKSEKDALQATLFFNVAHYVLRPWPWILVGLCSIVVYPTLQDLREACPHVDPALVDHDTAYPIMLLCLPTGWMGLMVAGMIAANSSTILTHLNWGASYLVHDFYRRFLRPNASERHYVWAGRLSTILLFLCAGGLTFYLDTAKDNFNIMLQVGAGTGLLYLVRWFWWRVNAWCEVAAMISSFLISVGWLIVRKSLLPGLASELTDPLLAHGILIAKQGANQIATLDVNTHVQLLLTIAITTLCWVLVAYLGPATDRKTLIDFYRKVRPFGPGWNHIRAEAGLTEAELTSTGDNIPLSLLGWVAGCTVIWSSLFTVGNFLYDRPQYTWPLLAVTVVSGSIVAWIANRLWNESAARSQSGSSGNEPH